MDQREDSPLLDYFRRHHAILYAAIVIMLILAIATIFAVIFQMGKLSSIGAYTVAIDDRVSDLSDSVDSRLAEINSTLDNSITAQQKIVEDLELIKLSSDFTAIAERASRSVVRIDAINDDYTDGALGTGFFLTSDGYVVTNSHVIENQTFLNVITKSGETYRANVIGVDTFKDVALLKISRNTSYLKLADSNNVLIGQKVIAIGTPLGLDFSVTEGVVSGLKREGMNGLQSYIQIDVPINPGNSGGPLIDNKGEVVGLHTWKVSYEGIEGLGFSLESNELKKTINALAGFELLE